jgi:hypothetical protein
MMRLLKYAGLLVVLWGLYWAVAGFGLQRGIAKWFDVQAEQGWQADYADLSLGGFPTRHVTTLTSPALADPSTGTAWQADWLRLENPAIWPGQMTVFFPDTTQRFSYFDQTVALQAEAMQADLHLWPGAALELGQMVLRAQDWMLSDAEGSVMAADNLTLSMVQQEPPERYAMIVEAQGFTPGDGLRRATASDYRLPRSFETLQMDMQVSFDRPWDRSALEDSRPQPRQIDLNLAELHWGALHLKAAGSVTVDDQGVPTGEISIKAENWREMLTMAAAAGVIPQSAVSPAERVLGVLAGMGGQPNTLDVKLGLKDGFVSFGPLPLGPAPRLILR